MFFWYVQEVDKTVYIDELDKLKIFASTMPFMIGSNLRSVPPKFDYDFRRHLEKYLTNNPNVLNDYDKLKEKGETDAQLHKSITELTKMVNALKKGIEADMENRRMKNEAVGNH